MKEKAKTLVYVMLFFLLLGFFFRGASVHRYRDGSFTVTINWRGR